MHITLTNGSDTVTLRQATFGDSYDVGAPKVLARVDSNDYIRFSDRTWHTDLSYIFNTRILKCRNEESIFNSKDEVDSWLVKTNGKMITYNLINDEDEIVMEIEGILTLSDCVERIETWELGFIITEALQNGS